MENLTVEEREPEKSHGIGDSELFIILRDLLRKIFLNPFLIKILRKTIALAGLGLIIVFILSIFLYIVPALQDLSAKKPGKAYPNAELKDDPAYKKNISSLARDVQRLSRKYSLYTPGQSYLVINTTINRFDLYRNKKLIRQGFCSSGSYTRLIDAEGNREWIFKTPKGRFWIQSKITKPLWVRPDWSFVEEGLPVPPANDESRYEVGVLGDYAMSLGDGYLIHGTIYKRFLGMPVTHGCVRLNDEDLEVIFNTLLIGSKVYIF